MGSFELHPRNRLFSETDIAAPARGPKDASQSAWRRFGAVREPNYFQSFIGIVCTWQPREPSFPPAHDI